MNFMTMKTSSKSFRLVQPVEMSFSTSPLAAETPASHMHRTTSLDRSITSFFENQTGQELSLQSLTKFMDESLLRG